MNDSRDTAELGAEFTQPPFLYEIRVKGRLSEEQWASWFDDLTISTRQGESILQGRALDHAALGDDRIDQRRRGDIEHRDAANMRTLFAT